jgi:hypothetical protein
MTYTIQDQDGRSLRYRDPFEVRDIHDRAAAMRELAQAVSQVLPDEALRFLERLRSAPETVPRNENSEAMLRILRGGEREPCLVNSAYRGGEIIVCLTPVGQAVWNACFYLGNSPAVL